MIADLGRPIMQPEIVFEKTAIDENGIAQFGPAKERTHIAIIIFRIIVAMFAIYVYA
jgi:hypothetical protein